MTRKQKTKNFLYAAQILCSLFGVGLSLALLVQHTRLKSGIQDSASACSINRYLDCDVVGASPYSEIFGVPIAAVGAVFFFVLFLLTLLAQPDEPNFPKLQRLGAILSLLGIGVDLYYLGVQVLLLRAICLFCVITYVLNALYFVANALLCERRRKGVAAFFTDPIGGKTTAIRLPAASWGLALSALLSFVATIVLLPSAIWIRSNFYSYGMRLTDQFYAEWKERTASPVPVTPSDPVYGPPDAPVKIVVFSDFECPHCRKAAFTLHAAVRSLGNRAQLVFKHYPLDSSCNSDLDYPLHPKACKLARLGHCANKKGEFWSYHDRIFLDLSDDSGLPAWENLTEKLSRILSPSEIDRCLNDPASLAAVVENIKAARVLGIKGTPTVYINGKLVGIPLTVETIGRLVELEP